MPSREVITECWNEFNLTQLSDIPLIVDISTPNITDHEESDPRDESNQTKNHFIPSPANLNPLADPFIPLLSGLDMSTEKVSESTGIVSLNDTNDPKSLLTGLKEKNSECPVIAHLNITQYHLSSNLY